MRHKDERLEQLMRETGLDRATLEEGLQALGKTMD